MDPQDCLSTRDYSVWITVNGTRVPIYGITTASKTNLSGYIEAREGAEFKVHYTPVGPPSDTDRAAALELDGSQIALQKISRSYEGKVGPENVVEGQRTSPTTIRPLVFTKVAASEHVGPFDASSPVVDKLQGTITLKFHRIRIEGVQEVPRFVPTTTSASHEVKSHEGAVEKVAGLGPARSAVPKEHLRYSWLDRRGHPFSTIEFRYVSRGVLQERGLLPPRNRAIERTPAPTVPAPPLPPTRLPPPMRRRVSTPPVHLLQARRPSPPLPVNAVVAPTVEDSSPADPLSDEEEDRKPTILNPRPIPSPPSPASLTTPQHHRLRSSYAPSPANPIIPCGGNLIAPSPNTHLARIQAENQQLRIEIAQVENQKLREQLRELRGKENDELGEWDRDRRRKVSGGGANASGSGNLLGERRGSGGLRRGEEGV